MGTQQAFAKITNNQSFRGCDPKGCGAFGSKRTHGKHQGVDVVTAVGQNILSPISGTVTRFPFPYGDDLSYNGIEIKNEAYTVKIFYCKAVVVVNTKVKAGQIIAKAQNISAKHGAAMTNHVHIEVYDKTGKLLNPEKLF